MKVARFYIAGALIVFGLLILPFVMPVEKKTAIYYSVDKDHGWKDGVDWVAGEETENKFIILNSKLYILFQVDKSMMFFSTVNKEHWDSMQLSNLRSAHKELENYWPDKGAPNLGVKWIQ